MLANETRWRTLAILSIKTSRVLSSPGLREDQISISKYGINILSAVATKLGNAVALLYSDTNKALAIQKSVAGGFKVRQLGKIKSTRSVYCKGAD